jgi:DNA uptake protein ComE-like DNA-binding protein
MLAHRDSNGGFGSLEELDRISGFPKTLLDSIKGRLTL